MAPRKPPKKTRSRAASSKKKPAKRNKSVATKKAPTPKPVAKPVAPLRPRKALMRRNGTAAPRLAVRPKPRLGGNPYEIDLDRNPANHQPLTPLTFLERAASVFPDRRAVVHGAASFTYAQFYERAKRLASALVK